MCSSMHPEFDWSAIMQFFYYSSINEKRPPLDVCSVYVGRIENISQPSGLGSNYRVEKNHGIKSGFGIKVEMFVGYTCWLYVDYTRFRGFRRKDEDTWCPTRIIRNSAQNDRCCNTATHVKWIYRMGRHDYIQWINGHGQGWHQALVDIDRHEMLKKYNNESNRQRW